MAPDAGRTEEDTVEGSPALLSQAQPDAATVASEGATQSVPPEAQAEVTATATSPVGLDVAMVASEGMAQSAPPVA